MSRDSVNITDDPLEKRIEARGTTRARERGVLHLKFTSPGRIAMPDRLLLANVPEFLRPVLAKYVRFAEYKRRGKKATSAQLREHQRLRDLGFQVDLIDNVADAENNIDSMGDQ